jgi:hypothetical protein
MYDCSHSLEVIKADLHVAALLFKSLHPEIPEDQIVEGTYYWDEGLRLVCSICTRRERA